MGQLLLIAVFGALGSVSRYLIGELVVGIGGGRLPLGTLLVNVLGSLLMGLIMYLGLTSSTIPPAVRMPIAVGFLGAFTTFSTFSYETTQLLIVGDSRAAIANIGLNLTLCLLATAAGIWVGRVVMGTA
ncbi:MAG: fluoride efflux transporter CrcB [Proteobacteria bacterium]|nr:fluoride efflux transporter CrcB [Pseudomonadota bacterium]